MVIKRKDGSTYKLTGPNPIMAKQSVWEEDKSIIHNFHPEELVTKESSGEEDEYEEDYVVVNHEPPEPISLEDIQAEEIEVPVKELDKSMIPDMPKKKERVVPKDVPKEMVYCLPAEVKESYDPLYDERRSNIYYGAKFTMEAIFLRRSDLAISVWSNTAKLGRGSIVYVPKDKRWWKVSDVLHQNNGHTMTCVPSDLQPSFD